MTETIFETLRPIPALQTHTSYRDKHGNICRFCIGNNADGSKKYKNLELVPNQRIIRGSEEKGIVHIPGEKNTPMTWTTFLLKSNWCYNPDDKTSTKKGSIFKVQNMAKDAKDNNSRNKLILQARMTALEMEGDMLRYMAKMVNETSEDENIQKQAVERYAQNNPVEFNRIIQQGEYKVRGLATDAKNKGIIEYKNFDWLYKAPKGSDQEDIIISTKGSFDKMLEDLAPRKELLQAIEDRLAANGTT